jgi:Cu-Zn family superoxide dismutase
MGSPASAGEFFIFLRYACPADPPEKERFFIPQHKIASEVIAVYYEPRYDRIGSVVKGLPEAQAAVKGSPDYPDIHGMVFFYQLENGVLLVAQMEGLPHGAQDCPANVFGFHIHEGAACTGSSADPFAGAGGHYNPDHCPHPAHAGDLPPLFGSRDGYAFQSVFTDRFSVSEIIGRTVIVHLSPDDFTTQPSGNSGARIACGLIRFTDRRNLVPLDI